MRFSYVVGDKCTYVDLGLLHVLRATAFQFPDEWTALTTVPLLKSFKQRMEERPRLAAYFKSDRCRPFEGNSMMWWKRAVMYSGMLMATTFLLAIVTSMWLSYSYIKIRNFCLIVEIKTIGSDTSLDASLKYADKECHQKGVGGGAI